MWSRSSRSRGRARQLRKGMLSFSQSPQMFDNEVEGSLADCFTETGLGQKFLPLETDRLRSRETRWMMKCESIETPCRRRPGAFRGRCVSVVLALLVLVAAPASGHLISIDGVDHDPNEPPFEPAYISLAPGESKTVEVVDQGDCAAQIEAFAFGRQLEYRPGGICLSSDLPGIRSLCSDRARAECARGSIGLFFLDGRGRSRR